jgi:hypothetical protein
MDSGKSFVRSETSMISDKDRVYIGHILECAALIQHYTRNGKADFIAMMQELLTGKIRLKIE